MGKPKKHPITTAAFNALITTDDWNIDEIPEKHWDKLHGVERLHDAVAVMGSGSVSPGTLNGIFASAGIDVLTRESRPKPGEPEGNAYHYVFQKLSDDSYLMHGPFRSGTVVPHWFDADDLDKYWTDAP